MGGAAAGCGSNIRDDYEDAEAWAGCSVPSSFRICDRDIREKDNCQNFAPGRNTPWFYVDPRKLQPFGSDDNETGPWMEQDSEVSQEHRIVLGTYLMRTGTIDRLGEGTFCHCWRGTDSSTGREVAIKTYKKAKHANATLKKFARQIEVLQEFAKPFPLEAANEQRLWHERFATEPTKNLFMELLAFSKSASGEAGVDPRDGTLYAVTELAQFSLQAFIKDLKRRQCSTGEIVDQARTLAGPVLLATAALHAKSFVHMDLKPSNVMSFNGRWKIIDLDGCLKVGTIISGRDATVSFSPCYCSPEFALFVTKRSTIKLQPALDAWSIGLVLLEMIELSPVFYAKYRTYDRAREFLSWYASSYSELLDDVMHRVQARVHPSLVAGMRGLLAKCPSSRQSCAEVLRNPYFVGSLDCQRVYPPRVSL